VKAKPTAKSFNTVITEYTEEHRGNCVAKTNRGARKTELRANS